MAERIGASGDVECGAEFIGRLRILALGECDDNLSIGVMNLVQMSRSLNDRLSITDTRPRQLRLFDEGQQSFAETRCAAFCQTDAGHGDMKMLGVDESTDI